MIETITIIRATGRRLGKLIKADGSIVGYDSAKTFDLAEMPVIDLEHLRERLSALTARPDCCIVRGGIADHARTVGVRRLVYHDAKTGDAPTICDADRRWIGLDIEGVPRPYDLPASDLIGCARVAIKLLPTEFHEVRCIVQATSGHGLKPGSRLRLWYWANRPLSGAELSYWLRRSPVDNCLFRPGQPLYTAAPIFEGCSDHLIHRMAMVGDHELVQVPPPDELCRAKITPAPARPRKAEANTIGERMIAACLLRVALASDGQRHKRLRAAARTIGGILDQADVSEQQATQALFDAVQRAGGDAIDAKNASETIAWGLAKGRAAPFDLGGSN